MPDTNDQDTDGFHPGSADGTGGEPLVCVLGPCVVTDAAESGSTGTPIELSLVQRTVLARLALARPGSVDAEDLIDSVWGDAPPATARTSIHNQISRIRNRLGVDTIVTDGGRYTLGLASDLEAVTSTLEAVELLVAQARYSETIQQAEVALAHWRGEPFGELGELDEARRERRRLFEVRRSLETLRLEAAIGDGRVASAIPEAERLIADTPDDEHRWVLLIRSLELAGRRGDALGAYERARRRLALELGIDPGPELVAAESSVLGTPVTKRTAGVAPLVGRADLVSRALARCDTGGPVVLVGEAGIGKSRVLEDLWRRLRRRGVMVATSACTLHPDTAVATLRELADDLGAPLDAALPPVAAFVAAITRLIDSGTEVVLIVDDFDRAGPTSTMALQAAADIDGVVLLATASDAALLPRELSADVLVVEPLGTAELAELAGFHLGDHDPVDQRKLTWLLEMSGGNPAILEHMLEAPVWPDRGDDGDLSGNGGPAPSDALRHAVRRRLDRLGANTRTTLEVAAVCGPRCPADMLVELTPEHGIAGGVAAALLAEVDDDDGRAWISFRHGAVRRILYDDMSPGRRMEIHHRAAGLLRAADAPAASIAAHALASVEVDPLAAVEDAFAAARAALGHGAHADAAQWFERALAAVERTGADDALRVEALVGMGDSLRLAGAPEQGEALFAAAEAAFALGDERLIGDAAFAVLQLGATTESGVLHDRAIELADRALLSVVEPDQRALIAGAASLAHSMTGDSALCRALFLAAESSAESSATRRHVLPFAYLGLGHPRDLELRERITDELMDLARAADDPNALFEGLQLSFSVGLQRCDGIRVRSAVDESARLIDAVGDVGRRWSLAYQQAAVAHLDGDLDLSEVRAEEALGLFAAVSPARAMATYGAQILVIRLAQGRLGELTATVEDLVAEQPGVPAWHAALALAVAPEEPDRARHHVRAALDDVVEDFTWLAGHLIGGRAAALVGDDDTRTRYVERLAPYSGLGCWQGTCSYGPVDTVLALLHSALDNEELASEHLCAARSQAHALGAPVFEAELDRHGASTMGR